MKKVILLLLVITMAAGVWAQGIEFFHGTYEEALKKAQTEKKQLFIDVYTSWCGPCKMMAKEVFTDEKVAQYFNTHFVCLKLDAEKEKEHVFFKEYQANGYPSFFWLTAQGQLLDMHVGYAGPEKFLGLAKAAGSSDLNKRLEEGQRRWEQGERSPQLVKDYVIDALGRVKPQKMDTLVLEYLKGLSEEQLLKEENYHFMHMFMYRSGDNFIFRTLMKNAAVYQQYGKNYAFWIDMYRMVVRYGISYREDPGKYQEYLAFLKSLDTPLANMYREILDMEYCLFQKNFAQGIPEATTIIAKYEKDHPYLAGQFLYTLIIAGFFQEAAVSNSLADQVIAWAEKALQTIPSKENLLYLSVANARKGDYKKAYELMASEPFFPEPVLSNALYKYLDLPIIHRLYLK